MLQAYRIIELATHIAAPAAGGVLADWGADVIKIESPTGDPMRWLRAEAPGGCSPVFEVNNRGKRSLALDVGRPDGREVLLRLVRGADVFLTSLRPGSLARAGLDWESLRRENPRLVYASVTGYGLTGEDADTPAFDAAAFWSRSSLAHLMAEEDGEPFPMRLGSGDHTCGLTAALGIVTALLAREKTGQGALVETSLLRAGIYVQGADLANHVRLGLSAQRRPRRDAANAFTNYYRTRDGRWLFVMTRGAAPDDWQKICRAAGCDALVHDPRLADAASRARQAGELVAALDAAFGQLDFSIAAARLKASGVVWAPVQTPAEVVADPQALDSGCLVPAPDAGGGEFLTPAPPVRFDLQDVAVGRPPRLGEHTEAILAELGLAPEAVKSLREQELVS